MMDNINTKDLASVKVGAVIFIRSDSRRLPRKTFLPLGGKSLYRWTIDAMQSLSLDEIIVATSDQSTDDDLAKALMDQNINVFRGSKNDIARRALDCCAHYELDYFLRVNGDSPFVNIPLLSEGIEKIDGEVELISNLLPRNYPYGVSCEILNVQKFEAVYPHLSTDQKTHITQYYYQNIDDIKYTSCDVLEEDLSKTRMAIDTPEDYAKMQYYLGQSELSDFNDLPISNLIKNYKEIIDDKFVFHKA